LVIFLFTKILSKFYKIGRDSIWLAYLVSFTFSHLSFFYASLQIFCLLLFSFESYARPDNCVLKIIIYILGHLVKNFRVYHKWQAVENHKLVVKDLIDKSFLVFTQFDGNFIIRLLRSTTFTRWGLLTPFYHLKSNSKDNK
jgi:hypothetical protein